MSEPDIEAMKAKYKQGLLRLVHLWREFSGRQGKDGKAISKKDIWDYCFRCGKPLTEGMEEGKDWFCIRNCGECFPVCKTCDDLIEEFCSEIRKQMREFQREGKLDEPETVPADNQKNKEVKYHEKNKNR